MAMREARYWSRLGEAVVGMVGGAGCWARAVSASRTGAAKIVVRDRMAEMLSRGLVQRERDKVACAARALLLYTERLAALG